MPKTRVTRRRSSTSRPATKGPSEQHALVNLAFVARNSAADHPHTAHGHVSMAEHRRAWALRQGIPFRVYMLTDAFVHLCTGLYGIEHLRRDFVCTVAKLGGWFPNVRLGTAAAGARVGPIRLGDSTDGGLLEFFAGLTYVHLECATLAYFQDLFQVDVTTVSHTLRAVLVLLARGWVPLYYSAETIDWARVVRLSAGPLLELAPMLPTAIQARLAAAVGCVAVVCVDGMEVHVGEPYDLALHRTMGSPKNKFHKYGFKLLLVTDASDRPLFLTAHLHGARTEGAAAGARRTARPRQSSRRC